MSYVLTTAENELGVVVATGAAGNLFYIFLFTFLNFHFIMSFFIWVFFLSAGKYIRNLKHFYKELGSVYMSLSRCRVVKVKKLICAFYVTCCCICVCF